ncbi:MAG: acyl carrier protein [Clostridiales bacterium]|jgi:D-alanine--poly(phosphoribitol) ligase subunit 2|nr:acyl carrier protein [Clostridiales bacterium]
MQEKIREIMANLNSDLKEVDPTEDLLAAGLIDSFDIVSLVLELEDAFGVKIEAEEIVEENFSSIANIQALIERKAI